MYKVKSKIKQEGIDINKEKTRALVDTVDVLSCTHVVTKIYLEEGEVQLKTRSSRR